MSWRIYPELGIERWLSSEDPPPAVVDAVLWVWLPVLETFGPFAQEAEVGLLLYAEDNGFVSLQLPDYFGGVRAQTPPHFGGVRASTPSHFGG